MFTESLEVFPLGDYQILGRGDVHIFNNLGAFFLLIYMTFLSFSKMGSISHFQLPLDPESRSPHLQADQKQSSEAERKQG